MRIISEKMENSDSEGDMYLVQCLEEIEVGNELKHNPTLFVRPDGLPMAFHIVDNDGNVKLKIEDHGGVVVCNESDMYMDYVIKICSGNAELVDSVEVVFDVEFIHESIKQGNIVCLGDYRINNSLGVLNYDPTDVLLGYKTWKNVEISEEIVKNLVEGNVTGSKITNLEDLELITEDGIWEGRNPEQVFESQEPDKLTYESPDIRTPEYIQSLIHGNFEKNKVARNLDVKDTKVKEVKHVASSKVTDTEEEELIIDDEFWEDWDPGQMIVSEELDESSDDSQVIGTPEYVQSLIHGHIK